METIAKIATIIIASVIFLVVAGSYEERPVYKITDELEITYTDGSKEVRNIEIIGYDIEYSLRTINRGSISCLEVYKKKRPFSIDIIACDVRTYRHINRNKEKLNNYGK